MAADENVGSLIDRLAEQARRTLKSETEVAAAKASGALPVYSDFTVCLLLRKDLEVVQVDHDSVSVRVVAEENWRRLVFQRASERYPELAALRPKRHAAATDCDDCRATGRFHGVICGACMGTGWR